MARVRRRQRPTAAEGLAPLGLGPPGLAPGLSSLGPSCRQAPTGIGPVAAPLSHRAANGSDASLLTREVSALSLALGQDNSIKARDVIPLQEKNGVASGLKPYL